jgi:manganese oxidase
VPIPAGGPRWPDAIVLDRGLRRAHPAGAIITDEFVRYRWYPDAQVGTAYFHDHVNGLNSWQHGLVGALVVEPPGATYHDPVTGEAITSGPIADIRVPDRTPVSADVTGSFRELVSFVQDGSPAHARRPHSREQPQHARRSLDRRGGSPDRAFSSTAHGDPVTPLLRAYLGDPLVVRVTVGGTNEVHTWHLDGHWFRREPWSTESMATSTARVGISERMDLVVPAAGGPQQRGGDYLYSNGRALKLREGSWGFLRVHDDEIEDLTPLPGRPPLGGPAPPICPASAPRRELSVAAIEAALPMLGPRPGRIFALESEADAVQAGDVAAEPLVLRAAVGDCLVIELQNRLPAGSPPVSLHADGLAYDPADSAGIEVGDGPPQVVPVGERRAYTFFAHPECGEGAAMLRDGGDLAGSGALGLYGAVVIGPPGVVYEPEAGWLADAQAPDGRRWRDVALLLHDEDDAIGSHRMPYTTNVRGAVGLNYGIGATAPVLEAYAGDPLRISLLAPWSEQVQVFSLEGHQWSIEPRMAGSTRVGSTAIGGLEALTIVPVGGAGGEAGLASTYGFGNHREPYREAGVWSTMVVHDRCGDDVDGLARITSRAGCDRSGSGDRTLVWAIAAAIAAGLGLTLWRRRPRLTPGPQPSWPVSRAPGARHPHRVERAVGRPRVAGRDRRAGGAGSGDRRPLPPGLFDLRRRRGRVTVMMRGRRAEGATDVCERAAGRGVERWRVGPLRRSRRSIRPTARAVHGRIARACRAATAARAVGHRMRLWSHHVAGGTARESRRGPGSVGAAH